MPQNPMSVSVLNLGGSFTALNVTVPKVIKTGQSVVMRVIVNVVGTSGNLTVNDNTITGGSNVAANTILNMLFSSLTVGQSFELKAPCVNGIVVSSVPAGGAVAVSYS
jgi:hypothetical protein